VILAAAAGALRALLASRGEQLDLVTASAPVSARQAATGGQLGNQVGVMPVALPTGGDLATRVTQIAAITRARKTAARSTSAAVLGLPFRLLAPTGLLRWFINRQRLIHSFVTNLRGPAEPLTFASTPVRAVIPISKYDRQRDRHLWRAVLRRDAADHRADRPQPGARRGRANGPPCTGTSAARPTDRRS
jgi:diacylglycerol O-acyltransferase